MKKHIVCFNCIFIFIQSFISISIPQSRYSSPLPEDSDQLILVLTDSASATTGNLYRYEKRNKSSNWQLIKEKIPIVLGRNGMAWGRGLNPIDTSKLDLKIEGDGKSPAGVFRLSAAFGYADPNEMKGLKLPYIHITEMLECIDDAQSDYYNQLVFRNEVDTVDWQSSEKMRFADIWYEQGIVVDQNIDPVVKQAGSCIFLHNWFVPDETSAGCTEMEPANLREIIYWLDSSANPVLVQLTHQLYIYYQQLWGLPDIIKQHEL